MSVSPQKWVAITPAASILKMQRGWQLCKSGASGTIKTDISERKGFNILFKLLQKDAKTLEPAQLRQKYSEVLPLAEEAIVRRSKGALANLVPTSFGVALGFLLPFRSTAEKFIAALGDVAKDPQTAGAAIVASSLIMFSLAAQFIIHIAIKSNRQFKILRAFDGAGMKLFEKKEHGSA